MQKIKDEDMYCCRNCVGTSITEKCWIFINDVIAVNGECYQRVDECDSDIIWCKDCNDACHLVNLKKWKKNNPKR